MAAKEEHPKSDSRTREVTYLPDSRFGVASFGALRALVSEVVRFRSHIATMFWGDFRSSYRGTMLGVFWNIVIPLVPISVYLLLVATRVFPAYEGMNPALYIGFNVTVWYLFTGFVTRPITVVRSKVSSAMKTSMPLSASIASSFAQLAFDTLVRLVFIVLLVVAYQQWPDPNVFGLLFTIFSALMFSFGIGLILAIANIVYTDVERVVTIVFQYGLFLSGVIFPLSFMGPLSFLETVNPFAVFVTATRDYLFFGTYPHWTALCSWAGAGVVFFLLAVRFFYVMELRIRGTA